MEVGLFSHITSRTRGTSLKLLQGKFRLEARENFFTKGLPNTGSGCPQECWSHHSLMRLKDMLMWHPGACFSAGLLADSH